MKSIFSVKVITQGVVIALISVLITNQCNKSNERKNNYNRLIQELEWNLSELREYDLYLRNLEIFSIDRLLLINSLVGKKGSYSNLDIPSMRLPRPPLNINLDHLCRIFKPQTRNYIISELSKTGFLYNLKRKQDVKYLEKMSDPNWLNNIIEPMNDIDIYSSISIIKGNHSEEAIIEQKTRNKTECQKIMTEIKKIRSILKSAIKQLEELIEQIIELSK